MDMKEQKSAIELIAQERTRQVNVEGWTDMHDDEHDMDQMARAAASYATPGWLRDFQANNTPILWPWYNEWWKPTPEDRVRELVKAGALIVAEIERLQRIEAQ